MSLDLLSRDIFLQAEEEIKDLDKQAEQHISQLKEEAQKRIQEYKDNLYKKFEVEEQSMKGAFLGSYQRDAKKIILEAKTNVLNDVKENTLTRINELDDKEKKKICKRVFDLAKKEMSFSTIYCNKENSKLISSLTPKSCKVVVRESEEGFEFESKDKKQIITVTFEDLLDDIIDKRGAYIQELLFN